MIISNQLMQHSDWKKRCEAALLTVATLTVKWSGEKAERKRLTHAMFKVRHCLEQIESVLDDQRLSEGQLDEDQAGVIRRLMLDARDITKLNTAGIGKKAAKKEGLTIE